MSSKEGAVAELFSQYFDIHDALDQAQYLLSISDPEDAREWLIDALGVEDGPKVNEFLSQVFIIKEGHIPNLRNRGPVVEGNSTIVRNRGPVVPVVPTPVVVVKEEVLRANSPSPPPMNPKMIPESRKSFREKCYCLAKTELGGHPLIGNCLS
jgi:hypothetical protein